MFPANTPKSKCEKLVTEMVKKAYKKYGLLAICDVVWNHTANNTKWLEEHPEAGYNLQNSPHLRPAAELDAKLLEFSGRLEECSLPCIIKNDSDLESIVKGIKQYVIDELKLWQFYVVDVEAALEEFDMYNEKSKVKIALRENKIPLEQAVEAEILVGVGSEPAGPANNRYSKKLLTGPAISYLSNKHPPKVTRAQYKTFIDEINTPCYEEFDRDVGAILVNIKNYIKYTRMDANGPQKGRITLENPVVENYFTRLSRSDEFILANNGWVWDAQPLHDFAAAGSRAYLKREVIVWSDSVKLRYGLCPQDNPWLWNHMKQYTEKSAKIFHGFRIDNCHSTPIHLAAYLLDAARAVCPNLLLIAELFTGSEEADTEFVSKLGLHTLVREALQPGNSFELSRLVHRHGGWPFGSLHSIGDKEVIRLRPTRPHALFYDCTHDNESPKQKRTAEDALSTAALVAMTASVTGSVHGYDECYPKHLDLVKEKRKYQLLNADKVALGPGNNYR